MFQIYKKVPSGFMHISSVLANSRVEAIEHFKNSQPNTKDLTNKEYLKTYYVGGLLKPRFNTQAG
jgi:hypothetical protein